MENRAIGIIGVFIGAWLLLSCTGETRRVILQPDVLDGASGSDGLADTTPDDLESSDLLEDTGSSGTDTAPALSAFAYEGTDCRVVHLVNYDYNSLNDTTTPVYELGLEIPLDGLQEESLTVTYYTPDFPQGQEPGFIVDGQTISLTIPILEIWGVLLIED